MSKKLFAACNCDYDEETPWFFDCTCYIDADPDYEQSLPYCEKHPRTKMHDFVGPYGWERVCRRCKPNWVSNT